MLLGLFSSALRMKKYVIVVKPEINGKYIVSFNKTTNFTRSSGHSKIYNYTPWQTVIHNIMSYPLVYFLKLRGPLRGFRWNFLYTTLYKVRRMGIKPCKLLIIFIVPSYVFYSHMFPIIDLHHVKFATNDVIYHFFQDNWRQESSFVKY